MAEDIRKTDQRRGPETRRGDGAAYGGGYGAGGLSSGADRTDHGHSAQNANTWDAPGVTPDGRRTGNSTEGPRMPVDGESDPDADPGAD